MDRYNFCHSAFSNALKRAADDNYLLPSHISLLAAIIYFGQQEAPYNPFQVSRRKLMRFSRIRSTGTYHKCLRELIEGRSEEHTSELQYLMRLPYAVFCLKKKKIN